MLELKPTISKNLLSRGSTFSSLTAVIEASKRFESVDSQQVQEGEKSWSPHAALASQPALHLLSKRSPPKAQELKVDHDLSKHKKNRSGTRICHFYNKFNIANCELPNNQCSRGYIHKCCICFKVACKAHIHHKASSFQFSPQGHHSPTSNSSHSNIVQANYVAPKGPESQESLINSVKSVVHDSFQSLKQDLATSIEKEVQWQLPQPCPALLSNATTTQDPLFSMPCYHSSTRTCIIFGLRSCGQKHPLG